MPPKRHHNVEAQRSSSSSHQDQDEIGLPRMVARTWGLISGISYVSNGGYLLMQSNKSEKCQGAGAYMIFVGLVIILLECACCLCPTKNNCCDRLDNKFPFWARGLMYILCVIPPLAICFGVKTLISSIIVIMLGLLYIFITCLVRSKKYERLRGEARQRYHDEKQGATVTYNAFTSTTNTLNSLKSSVLVSQNKGKKPRPKKAKPRTHTVA